MAKRMILAAPGNPADKAALPIRTRARTNRGPDANRLAYRREATKARERY